MDPGPPVSETVTKRLPAYAVFLAFLKLGLTSFGGPVAHIGYFREAFVLRRAWMDERGYADLVALCQMLPGPTSSQVGIGIGFRKAGLAGSFAAWLGFSAPSALALIALGYGVVAFDDALPGGLLHGLKAVVVAVVAQAVWGMGRTLCPDPLRATLAVLAAGIVLAVSGTAAQLAVIAGGAIAGLAFARDEGVDTSSSERTVPFGAISTVSLLLFFALLILLPLSASTWHWQPLALVDTFFRSGSLVFGGGHVVLPLLEASVLSPGWVSEDAFLAGYGAAQAVPGPLFTFAAYLGSVMQVPPWGWTGGVISLLAIFAPSFLLVIGTLPLWDSLRRLEAARRAMLGINASVVGLLLAALYDPVWTSGIRSGTDFALALAAFVLLASWKLPPWLVVVLGALGGWAAEVLFG